MKHERPLRVARTAIRHAPLLVFGLYGAVALAHAIPGPHPAIRREPPPFTVLATPRSRTVGAGAATHYWITVRRGRYRGKIRFIAGGPGLGLLPNRAANQITLKTRGQRVLLTVKTNSLDPAGLYLVRVETVGGKYRPYLTVGLMIRGPRPASVTIAGRSGPLWPGTAQSVDLALTNPNPRAISVRRLVVKIGQVRAPQATPTLPCSAADFSVSQFAGRYPLRVAAHRTDHLSTLGVPAAKGPQLVMLDRPVNQDGCQGATVTLSFAGTATSP
jgi:hypothetical protein